MSEIEYAIMNFKGLAMAAGTANIMKRPYQLAVEALEKQIAKKLINTSGGNNVCSCCNKFLHKNERSHGYIDIPYCKWCGQKLDWSDI